MDKEFIEERKFELQKFLNEFLNLRLVKECPLIPGYLLCKSADELSKEAIDSVFRADTSTAIRFQDSSTP